MASKHDILTENELKDFKLCLLLMKRIEEVEKNFQIQKEKT